MGVEVRKYNTDATPAGETYELSDSMSAWFRHYLDPSQVTGVI